MNLSLSARCKAHWRTSHYVTEQLDEGPIIEQDVVRVSHRNSVEDLVRLGKDVEKAVLARGVRAHL